MKSFSFPASICWLVLLVLWFRATPSSCAQELELAKTVPKSGTFYRVQFPNMPPLPYDPFAGALPVYRSGGAFLIDDSQVDYPLLKMMEEALSLLEGGEMTSLSSGLAPCDPCPPGAGGTNDPAYLGGWTTNAGLKFAATPFISGSNFFTTLAGASAAKSYQIFETFALAANPTNTLWHLVASGWMGQTNFSWPVASTNSAFYLAASFEDADRDGVSDAYEQLVSKTSTNSWDHDADGLPDGWELAYGLSPTNAADASGDLDGDGLSNLQEFLHESAVLRPTEAMGAASRRTPLVISEIMYRPPAGQNQFIEFYNSHHTTQDLSGFLVKFRRSAVNYYLLDGTLILPKSYMLLPVGTFLGREDDTVQVFDRLGSLLLEVSYDSKDEWPVQANRAGHSLVLTRPSWGQSDPRAWAASERVGGSPGFAEPVVFDPMRAIRINEYLADATNGQVKYIELYNASGRTVDILGCFLSTNRLNLRGFTNTLVRSIPPRGLVAFQKGTGAGQFSFDLHPTNGGTIFLTRPDLTAVIDGVAFGAQSNGASMGRFPDGVGNLLPLATPTRGTNNAPLSESPVVINEIMFNPVSGSEFDEYVELYNRGPSPVNLSGWKLSGVDNYTFANGTTVTNNGYLIVPRDRTNFLARYPAVPTNLVTTFYVGNLSNRRETLRLSRPHISSGGGVLMHELTYEDGGRWGRWTDGDGSSLELMDPRSDNRVAANWMDSDETAKSTNWTLVASTNIIDHVMLVTDINRLEITLQGAGECLVDNIEVWQNGVQYVTNGTFEVGGTGGWNLSGNHDQSGLESIRAYNSSKSLHLRATGRGDNLANFARGRLTNSVATNVTAEIHARVLWLAGSPDIVFRLIGNGLEAAGTLTVPKNLGTPGAVNSRYRTNNGPAIDEAAHWPPVPAANQRVLVTARVRDPDGLGSVVLRYRVDPATSISSVTMRDDGTDGDRLAGDGTYSGIIPGQPAGQMVAFHVQATDAHAVPQTNRFPAAATTRECLVLFGDAQPAGELPTYRLWMTRATAGNWISRGTAHNAPLDTTFVYGNQRVVYNAKALYSGSQFSSGRYTGPTNNLCSYALAMPEDDPVLGTTDFAIEFPVWDTHAQREQLSYWLANRLGLPSNHRRFIHFVVNGWTAGARTATFSNALGQALTAQIYEDSQQPNGDVVEQRWPSDAEGSLYKIEVATEQGNAFVNATLEPFLTANGMKKAARYRWNWRKRAVHGSAHDYSTLFALVDAANATTNYTATVEALVDVDEWMRLLAFERMVANWDTWGWRHGHNIYAYKGQASPWRLLPWDLDVSLGSLEEGYETAGLFDTPGDGRTVNSDPVLKQMIAHPPFRRMFWRAVQDAVQGPLRPVEMNPVMDANYALMQPAYSATAPGTSALLSPEQSMVSMPSLRAWITNRHAYLTQQLATVAAPLEISNNGGNDFTVTNQSTVTLLGKAPVEAAFLRLNGSGANAAVMWTSVTNWSLSVPLTSGANGFSVQGYNRLNEAISGATDSITITNQP